MTSLSLFHSLSLSRSHAHSPSLIFSLSLSLLSISPTQAFPQHHYPLYNYNPYILCLLPFIPRYLGLTFFSDRPTSPVARL